MSPGQPPRAVHCWACEDLLAIVPATGRLLLEADATLAEETPQHCVIACRCGGWTATPSDDSPH